MSDVTRILNAMERGDAKAADELLPLVYEELRVLGPQSRRPISLPLGRIRLMDPDDPPRLLAPRHAERYVRHGRPHCRHRILGRIHQEPHDANAEPEAEHGCADRCLGKMPSGTVKCHSRPGQAGEPKNEGGSQRKRDPLAGVRCSGWLRNYTREEPDEGAQTKNGPEPAYISALRPRGWRLSGQWPMFWHESLTPVR